ncbi:HAD family phosphatase [bacterium]|nr:HAD family phosphatase [candidate division CSSED10-310 bacterium]
MNCDLICFDVDGTLIDGIQFIWSYLHEQLGCDRERIDSYKQHYFSGNITYQQWAESDIRLWRESGATRRQLVSLLAGLRPVPGAIETLTTLHRAGMHMGIVSGSIDLALTAVLKPVLHWFVRIFINRLQFDEAGFLSGVEATAYDMAHKAEGVRRMAAELGVPLARTAFVGDHFNDVEAARVAGLSIAFNCKSDELASVADVTIDSGSLCDILPVVGL